MNEAKFNVNDLTEIIDSTEGERRFCKSRLSFGDPVKVEANDSLYPKTDQIFGEQQKLAGQTCYEVPGRGQFISDKDGIIRWVETNYGACASNIELNHLRTGCVYKVGPNAEQRKRGIAFTHWFMTHPCCETIMYAGTDFFSNSMISPGKRLYDHQQKEDIAPAKSGYDQGHLIAREFGGGMERINLVSMMRESNQWRKPETLENKAKKGTDEALRQLLVLRLDAKDADIKDIIRAYMELEDRENGEKRCANYRLEEKLAEFFLDKNYDVKLYIPDIVTVKAPDGMSVTSVLHTRIRCREHSSEQAFDKIFSFQVDIDTKDHWK